MGSGISITKEQAIDIIRRDIKHAFKEMTENRSILSDDGALLYETFEHEIIYRRQLVCLDDLQDGFRKRRLQQEAENEKSRG
jgi:hypothetical protein